MNNKVGIYYAYWTKSWDADFVPFVSKVKKLGFDILEVNSGTVTDMPNKGRHRLRNAAEKAGIELDLLHWSAAEIRHRLAERRRAQDGHRLPEEEREDGGIHGQQAASAGSFTVHGPRPCLKATLISARTSAAASRA